jgi:hypothetical protein
VSGKVRLQLFPSAGFSSVPITVRYEGPIAACLFTCPVSHQQESVSTGSSGDMCGVCVGPVYRLRKGGFTGFVSYKATWGSVNVSSAVSELGAAFECVCVCVSVKSAFFPGVIRIICTCRPQFRSLHDEVCVVVPGSRTVMP